MWNPIKERKRMLINKNTTDNRCPFCGKYVNHWANDAPSTNPDYYDRGEIYQGHGKFRIKRYFHKSCLKANSRGEKK